MKQWICEKETENKETCKYCDAANLCDFLYDDTMDYKCDVVKKFLNAKKAPNIIEKFVFLPIKKLKRKRF